MNETVTSAEIVDGAIVNADVSSSAAIAFSKMADLTASRLLVSDGNGDVSVSDVTSAEALLLDGGTSATSTTLAAADRLIVNDNGTIVQVALSDFETFFEGAIDTLSSAMTFSSTVTVGSDGSGQDVIFYSGTSGDNLTWDASEECLIITGTDGAQALKVADGDLVVVDKIYLSDNDGGEYISGDGTDLTITSGNDIVLAVGSGGSAYCAGAGGTSNTVFGFDAGDQLASGDNYNTFIGHSVATANMTNAVSNTGVGYVALASLTEGDNNTILGAESGYALTTGANNTFIGMQAGDALTQGDNNIAIGNAAMGALSTTDGSDKNIAIGNWAMDGVSSLAATENVFIGHNSGGGSWTGTLSQKNVAIGNATMTGAMNDASDNVAIGYNALTAATTGDDNVIIGSGAAVSLTTGKENVVVGSGAYATANTSENYGVAIGFEAAKLLDGIDNVTAVGHSALSTMVAVDGNTALGFEAGKVTTGGYNTYIGFKSGKGASGADANNTAVGHLSLTAITDGAYNTVLGAEAGEALTTGDENVFIGLNAGDSTTNVDKAVIIGSNAAGAVMASGADGAVAVGYKALSALTSGSGNTAVGYEALDAEDAGSASTAVGHQALGSQNNDTGYNTAVGWTAGDGIVAGYANTLIGAESGTTGTNDLTSGIQNVLIGQATSVSASGATNQIVIGRGAAGQADNSVTLGNADVTDVYMGSDSGAKVRCGVIVASQTADTYAAEIYGTASASSVTFINKASSGTYITWGTGGVAKGTISESGGTVSYGAFTAHHDAELPSPDNDDGYAYGTLVETTEIVYTQEDGVDSERGIVYKVQKSSSAYAKNVLGSYSDKYPTPDYPNLHRIYVLGDGHILCNGEKGNISVGDGICSSSTVGQGMKADKKTMIIGIAQEDVSFSGNESKLVVVQYGLQQFTTW